MHALLTVREAVRRCTDPLLDRHLLHNQPGPVRDFIDALLGPSQWPFWMDVPVAAVVGLHHLNFHKRAGPPSWRSAVEDLSATDWDERVFGYWREELRDKGFPAAHARRALRLTSLAGAVVSDNGVHRLAAGVAWLIAECGPGARLRMVRTTMRHPQDEVVFSRVVAMCAEARRVDIARLPVAWPAADAPRFAVRVRRDAGDVSIIDVDLARGLVARRPQLAPWRRRDEAPLTWEELPVGVLQAWQARQWQGDALARAERCPTRMD
ncbi:MAG: hypothetical protein EKK53_07710 [Burkholderiales bacterium]|nr:MAG: hypothetical protein EKK53_07710 [Burkholderiales bacterium]